LAGLFAICARATTGPEATRTLEDMNTLELSTSSDCEPHWLEQPVSVVATHISRVYHEFTRDQLPVIADLATRVQSISGDGWNATLPGLVSLLAQLRDSVGTHAWTEDDLLFPVLVAHEYPGVLQTNVSADDLLKLVETLSSEHGEIRGLIDEIARITDGFRAPASAPTEFEDLVRLVEELTRSLTEELDLEDRCLLPRARMLAMGGR
jgi:iron-sulfur cluster repair protein YtfE (RIC family)